MKKLIYLAILIGIVVSCDSSTFDDISDHQIIEKPITYNEEVKPIIENNCIMCHNPAGEASFQPWTDYDKVKSNVDLIIYRISLPTGDPLKMPKGGALSNAQIQLIEKWKEDGLLE